MKKFLVAATALSGLLAFAGSASAADLAAPVAPIYDWTGFYIGAQGGYQSGKFSGPFGNASQSGFGPYSFNQDQALIGGYTGYNFQMDQIVLGIEGDLNAGLGGRKLDRNVLWNGTTLYDIGGDQTWNGDVRARLGFALDRFMPYVAGGVAFGDVKTTYAFAGLPPFLKESTSRVGWTIGGGLDYAITDQFIGRVEYRYTDLGSDSFTNVGENTYDKVKFTSQSVLVGFAFKF
jgi:outer membrane immunogenic protein